MFVFFFPSLPNPSQPPPFSPPSLCLLRYDICTYKNKPCGTLGELRLDGSMLTDVYLWYHARLVVFIWCWLCKIILFSISSHPPQLPNLSVDSLLLPCANLRGFALDSSWGDTNTKRLVSSFMFFESIVCWMENCGHFPLSSFGLFHLGHQFSINCPVCVTQRSNRRRALLSHHSVCSLWGSFEIASF